MKVLPDYLIEYMPEIEAALEELRLSVLDHAYELLQRLDIDELSADEIRQKLELYDIKIENLTGDWLPNGRFYKLCPSIKHNRSRYNTIQAIAKSGGQFEGLWSTEFSNKSSYNFKNIQIARHYELKNDADGYFFVSGNTVVDAKGRTISSAAQALSTDVLINQALPAGYTYFYIPWPRPLFPGDAGYFYSVHMLMHDRLHYAEDCDHQWMLLSDSDKSYAIYYCADNSVNNRYCKVLKDSFNTKDITYSKELSEFNDLINPHLFDSTITGDQPFSNNGFDETVPASTKYDWRKGTNTPYRSPYWIDYHFMNDMSRLLPSDNNAGAWPIVESGKYLGSDGYEVFDIEDAVVYQLDNKCSELADTRSVFPTKCYLKENHITTEPNRLQKFTPACLTITIRNYNELRNDEDFVSALSKAISKPVDCLSNCEFNRKVECIQDYYKYSSGGNIYYKIRITISEDYYDKTKKHYLNVSYNLNGESFYLHNQEFIDGIWRSEPLTFKPDVVCLYVGDPLGAEFAISDRIKERIEDAFDELFSKRADLKCDYIFAYKYNYSIDENDLIEPDRIYSLESGPYRWDKLFDGFAHHVHDIKQHIKIYRPFWNEKSSMFEMAQSKYVSNITPLLDEAVSHSLFNWMDLKQIENRPSMPFVASASDIYDISIKSTISDNKPQVSEVTFTSYDRPTRSRLDNVYAGYMYASNSNSMQGDNNIIVPKGKKQIYALNKTSAIEYDPSLYYNIISVGIKGDDGIEQINIDQYEDNNSSVYLLGDPASKDFYLMNANNDVFICNYVTYKTSRVHKLWFDKSLKNIKLVGTGALYNKLGLDNLYIYSSNSVGLTYNIIGIYTEDGSKVNYANGGIIITVSDNVYNISWLEFTDSNKVILSAAYVLFTVNVNPVGSVKKVNIFRVESPYIYINHTNNVYGRELSEVTQIATYDPNQSNQ